MKFFTRTFKILTTLFFGVLVNSSTFAQCVTPVITSIGNSGPGCEGNSITLSAKGTVGGVSSSAVRMAGIGGNAGHRAFDAVFSSGDRAGSIARISNAQFDAIFAGQPTNAARAAALKAQYDVLMFTWASPDDANITWGLITAYLETGGSVFFDGDYANIDNLYDGTANSVIGVGAGTTWGCNYTIVSPAPFPSLVANGVNGCFANDHIKINSFPSWMKAYIKVGSANLAVAGIYPYGNQGRLILQGPDQDFHAHRNSPAGSTERNQYQFILNQMDFLTANQAGFTWTGPNGFTSNEANPVLSNITPAMAGTYVAKLTNTNGGCFTTDSTVVVINAAEIPTISASGKTKLCPGSTVTLTASAGGSYLWNTGATSQSIVVASSGNYSVKVAGSNGCIGTSASTSVLVNTLYCNAAPVAIAKSLTVQAGAGCQTVVAAIDFDGGSTDADGDSLSYSVMPAGPYALGVTSVVLTVTDPKGASSSDTTTITVEDKKAPIALAQNVSVTLVNGSATITAASVDNGSNDECGIKSVSIDKSSFDCSNLGNNAVILTVTDNNGNVSTDSATVNVIGATPVASIAVSKTDNTFTGLDSKTIALGYGAQALTLTASDSTSTSAASTYVWSPAAGLSSTTTANPVFIPTAAGTYTYNVTATNEFGCTASTSVTLTVIDVRCGTKNDKVLVCQKTGSAKNPWVQLCISASAVNAHLTKGSTLGTCGSTGTIASVSSTNLSLSSLSANSSNSLSAYPNPLAKQTTVAFNVIEDEAKVSLDLYNVSGAKVQNIYSGPAKASQEYSINYDASGIAPGVYFFKLSGSKVGLTFKVIVTQ